MTRTATDWGSLSHKSKVGDFQTSPSGNGEPSVLALWIVTP